MPDAPVIAPRTLVPTPRQVAEGEEQRAYEFEADAPAPKRGIGRRLGDAMQGLDPRAIKGPKVPLAVFMSVTFFAQMTSVLGIVIAPDLQLSFTSGPALIAFAGVALEILKYLLLPFYGWVVDRVNRVILLRIERILSSILFTTAAFATNVTAFFASFATGGVLNLGASTPQSTLMADYYTAESLGRIAALLPAVIAFANLVGPVAVGVLTDHANWRVAVFAVGCAGVAASLTTMFLREPKRGEAERRELGAEAAPEQEPMSFAESWRAAKSIDTLRRIWYATPFTIATGLGPVYFIVGLLLSQEYGLTATQRGLVTALMGASSIVALVGIGPLAGRLLATSPGRLMTLAAGFMILQASAAVFVASGVLVVTVLAVIPLSMGIAALAPLTQMVTLKVVPPRMRGLGLSTLAPWQLVGLLVYLFIITTGGAAGPRGMVLFLVPIYLVGAFLLGGAAASVDRDIKGARASVLAHEAVDQAKAAGQAKLLVCRGVEAAYGGTQVLFGVDLDVEDGELIALLGTNGAGKSTLLKAITGVHNASSGAILLDGRDVSQEPAHLNAGRGVVMMPGGKATFPTLSVEENLQAAGWLSRDEPEEVARRQEQVLEFFPVLRTRWKEAAGNLSGGEQQMVGLGQAFMMRPRLLMIDELSLGLAPALVQQLLETLRAIHAQGTTVILVEQSLTVALTIARRAVFMEKGVVRFDGPTEELLSRPELVRSVYIGRTAAGRLARPAAAKGSEGKRELVVEDVHVAFGGVQALRGAGLSVEPGRIVGVIGPNGAGKTTLFDVVSGFVRPDSGRVLFGDEDVTAMAPDARARLGLGRSFQSARLFPALTVRENIAVALERRTVRNELMAALWLPNVRRSEAKLFTRVDGLIELLGLEAFADKFANELSTGSRRAVEVACVMAAEPHVLLLDEPSSGLAQAETEALVPVLTRLVRETGCGLLVIEHDMPLISAVSDTLVAMELGQVIATGPPAEVLEDERVLASYLSVDKEGPQPWLQTSEP